MNAKDMIFISRQLSGMDLGEMTRCEIDVADILVRLGYLRLDDRTAELESKTPWLEYRQTIPKKPD